MAETTTSLQRRLEKAQERLGPEEKDQHPIVMVSSEDEEQVINDYCQRRGIDPNNPRLEFLLLVNEEVEERNTDIALNSDGSVKRPETSTEHSAVDASEVIRKRLTNHTLSLQ